MSRKSAPRKHLPKTISPLLGSLMQPEPNARDLKLLKAYTALDAMSQGKGTRAIFASLGQQMITCDELCTAGFVKEGTKAVREAHAALVRSDWDARSTDVWTLTGDDYEAVRQAMEVYEIQLRVTPHLDLLQAELRMIRQQVASEEAQRKAA